MGEKCLKIVACLVLSLFMSITANAQSADDVLRYSLQYPSYDAIGLVMPGVSDVAGFGSYQANPASMAFVNKSYMSFGLSSRFVSEDATYLGNTATFEGNQTNVGNAGFVYKVPTARGKLVFGAGYSQSHDFNRAFSGSGFNSKSTITDSYVTTPSDAIYFAAFDAYAIDNVNPDNEKSPVRSIFRVDSPYKGINQSFEVTEQGVLGEYSAFVATELAKNFIVGASIGVISGNYSYQRDFLESDSKNEYETQFEDEKGNLTGIDTILSEDTIESTFSGFTARVGAIYQISPKINIGGSYQFKNTINVDDKFNTIITNTLDDGAEYQADGPRETSYKIERPARLNLGVTASDLAGLTISASAERVAYSEGRVEFESLKNQQTEDDINSIVRSNLKDVYNFRIGLEYKVNNRITPRIGYGYYPSPTGDFEDGSLNGDRHFYSAGFSAKIGRNTTLNVGAQLGRWDSKNTIYTTTVPVEDVQVVTEEVQHWNVMAGIRFGF